ncbi:phosphonate C-P lyase system protein PhnL [Caldimonas brevitalea]|uniref:Alpha-D-ribose 1-methylphosphonate 5-triphosphate synthase subunit PhnL n=1 Tax=Caldimonas brevitalea TaxID=413882 RepID=A0A0G3BLT3_9BURK|nr:phosphonate C-P lyase system protein PhnL [Caldimonas brevitalea]AKJ30399.1 alpha-D-ribose 1-methylphosphonate 5-triphosphate synthase subunit PhnL [Caldimonas brevitalea]
MNTPIPDGLPVIDVQDLSKTFTLHLRSHHRLPVLDRFSLQVHAGECVALVGASGQGKSTVLKCLYGNYAGDDLPGTRVTVRTPDGATDLHRASPQEVLALRRHGVSYVSQFLRAVPRVSALDVVAERLLEDQLQDSPAGLDDPCWETQAEAAREQVRELFARLHLPPALWALPPSTFSGGEQQRVNIARGFVKHTPVLLLDEPTASLDATNRRAVVSLVRAARVRGAAIVGIFHDEEVRDAVATRCVDL